MHTQSEPSNPGAIKTPISKDALDQLFRKRGPTQRGSRASADQTAPRGLRISTSRADQRKRLACQIRFLTTSGGKARLQPALAPGQCGQNHGAPVTVIIAWDTEFHEHLPRLFPQADIRSYFVGNKPLIEENAFRNSSLQAAYFILAARALGLDCGRCPASTRTN